MADSKKYDGSQWEHSLRKMTTATADIEPTIYTDGTAITSYTIKGNTVQDGTPTPSAPISVNGVGDKTANLFDYNTMALGLQNTYLDSSGNELSSNDWNVTTYIPCDGTTFTLYPIGGNTPAMCLYDENKQFIVGKSYNTGGAGSKRAVTITSNTTAKYIRFTYCISTINPESKDDITALFLIAGSYTSSTIPPFEPYGYKIPISSGGVTTPIYFTQQLFKIGEYSDQDTSEGTATYNIRKYEFTGLENVTDNFGVTMVQSLFNDTPFKPEYLALSDRYIYNPIQSGLAAGLADGEFALQYSPNGYNIAIKDLRYASANAFKSYLATQYANGTPVTIYYVLKTPTTESVTAPSIPTVDGANSISVDTTVQPSEFTATWTGWHDSSVKEYDGTDWQ